MDHFPLLTLIAAVAAGTSALAALHLARRLRAAQRLLKKGVIDAAPVAVALELAAPVPGNPGRGISQQIFEASGTLMLLMDREGRIERFNPACEHLTGWSESEILGRPYWEALIPAAPK